MDRHEAIEWLNAIKEKYIRGGDDYYDRQRRFAIDWAIHLFKEDNVEVVRCKDCKHYVAPQGVPCCDCFYGLVFPSESGNDFCSYGERKDNAD